MLIMVRVTIEEMQRDPAGYLQRVEAGEALLITRAEKPVAEVMPVEAGRSGQRPTGLCAGQFRVPDDFDDPLPEDVIKDFEGQ